jgi:hypothetical protein
MTTTIIFATAAVSSVLGLKVGLVLAGRWAKQAQDALIASAVSQLEDLAAQERATFDDLDQRVADAEQQRVEAAEIRATAEKLGPRIQEAGRG